MFVPLPRVTRAAGRRRLFAVPFFLTIWVSAPWFTLPALAQFEDVRLVPVVDLAGVVDVSHAGDERLFLTTQSGTLHILQNTAHVISGITRNTDEATATFLFEFA